MGIFKSKKDKLTEFVEDVYTYITGKGQKHLTSNEVVLKVVPSAGKLPRAYIFTNFRVYVVDKSKIAQQSAVLIGDAGLDGYFTSCLRDPIWAWDSGWLPYQYITWGLNQHEANVLDARVENPLLYYNLHKRRFALEYVVPVNPLVIPLLSIPTDGAPLTEEYVSRMYSSVLYESNDEPDESIDWVKDFLPKCPKCGGFEFYPSRSVVQEIRTSGYNVHSVNNQYDVAMCNACDIELRPYTRWLA